MIKFIFWRRLIKDVETHSLRSIVPSLTTFQVSLRSMSSEKNSWYNSWPTQPPYNPQCQVNLKYTTLPCGTPFTREWAGKTLYPTHPNIYNYTYRVKPVGTMYDTDNTQYGPFGRVESYHHQVYPFTHRHVRERRDFATYMIDSSAVDTRWLQRHDVVEGGSPKWQQVPGFNRDA